MKFLQDHIALSNTSYPLLHAADKLCSHLGHGGKGPEPLVAASAPSTAETSAGSGTAAVAIKPDSSKHHALLLDMVSEQLGINPTDIIDFELNV